MAANLSWSKPFTKAFPGYNYDMTKGKVQYTWFEGGKINACYNYDMTKGKVQYTWF